MYWLYDEMSWSAASALHDDGSSFMWAVNVTLAGTFTINMSASELLNGNTYPHFDTLADAKRFCEWLESGSVI
jgi:hypothetical protein